MMCCSWKVSSVCAVWLTYQWNYRSELQIRSTPHYVNLSKKVENAKQWNVNFMQHGGPYLHGVMTQGCNIQKISGVFLWVSFALNWWKMYFFFKKSTCLVISSQCIKFSVCFQLANAPSLVSVVTGNDWCSGKELQVLSFQLF